VRKIRRHSEVPEATIQRLPRYLEKLKLLQAMRV